MNVEKSENITIKKGFTSRKKNNKRKKNLDGHIFIFVKYSDVVRDVSVCARVQCRQKYKVCEIREKVFGHQHFDEKSMAQLKNCGNGS